MEVETKHPVRCRERDVTYAAEEMKGNLGPTSDIKGILPISKCSGTKNRWTTIPVEVKRSELPSTDPCGTASWHHLIGFELMQRFFPLTNSDPLPLCCPMKKNL